MTKRKPIDTTSVDDKRPVGRPTTVAGRRRQVYLDEASEKTALRLGEGNVSEGIRIALRASELEANGQLVPLAEAHRFISQREIESARLFPGDATDQAKGKEIKRKR